MVSKGHLCFYSFCFKGREELWSRLPKKCYTNFFCKCNFRIFAKLANVQKKSTYLSCGPTDLYFCNFLPSPNAIYIHCKFPIKYMVPKGNLSRGIVNWSGAARSLKDQNQGKIYLGFSNNFSLFQLEINNSFDKHSILAIYVWFPFRIFFCNFFCIKTL